MFFFVEWDGVVLSDAAGLCSLQVGSPEVVEYLHDHVRFKLFAGTAFYEMKKKRKIDEPMTPKKWKDGRRTRVETT